MYEVEEIEEHLAPLPGFVRNLQAATTSFDLAQGSHQVACSHSL